MTCAISQRLFDLHLDGELTPKELVEVEDHIESCVLCQQLYDDLNDFQRRVRKAIAGYEPPAHLRRNIEIAVAQQARPAMQPWNWAAVAVSLLLFASLVWNISLYSRHSASDVVAQQVLSNHLRSIMGAHLLDVESSDQFKVRSWFIGKVDFLPEVKDFTSQGFRLLGGRIEYIDGRPVTALVYERQQHVMNLFLWPSESHSQGGTRAVKLSGYNLLSWTDEGITCWAASDLPRTDLDQFAKLYE